jgi:hypothetical protein
MTRIKPAPAPKSAAHNLKWPCQGRGAVLTASVTSFPSFAGLRMTAMTVPLDSRDLAKYLVERLAGYVLAVLTSRI